MEFLVHLAFAGVWEVTPELEALSLSLPLTNIPSPNLATLKKLKKQHKVNLPGRRLSSLHLLKSQKARNQSAVYKLRTMEYPTQ